MLEIKYLKFNPLKSLVILLELLAVGLIIYLIALPFYPGIKYNIMQEKWGRLAIATDNEFVPNTAVGAGLPQAEYAVSPNRVIINKIGVNAPIVESRSADYGLSKGAWRVPDSSTPDKGGNTVITGHRFKYLPPNNLTFYLFHKLVVGDEIEIKYDGKDYNYQIKEINIVPDTELSIMDPTSESILTLFTCHPIYSTEKRLVVVAGLMEG